MVDWDHYRALLAELRARDRSKSQIGLYPPAKEEQLRLTEERLGFSLPSALRLLYQEVGNGGDNFGDGYPINGVVGGFPENEKDVTWACSFTIDQVVSRSGWRLNDRVAVALQRYPGAYIECEKAPDRFVQIAHSDCTMSVELDGWTGALYTGACGQSVQEYWVGLGFTPPPDSEHAHMTRISFLAPCVESWIERMLAGGWRAYYATWYQGELTREMIDGDTPEETPIAE